MDLSTDAKPVKATFETTAATLLFHDRVAFFIALSVNQRTTKPAIRDLVPKKEEQ